MTYGSHEQTEVVRVRREEPAHPAHAMHEADNSVEHIESITVDPRAHRVAAAHKLSQAVYLLFGLLEFLVGIRLILKLLGANSASPFAASLYALTQPLLAPFVGIFPRLQYPGGVFEPEGLFAILILMLLAWLLNRVVWLLLDNQVDRVEHSSHAHRQRYP